MKNRTKTNMMMMVNIQQKLRNHRNDSVKIYINRIPKMNIKTKVMVDVGMSYMEGVVER